MNSSFYKSFRYSAAALLCSFVLLFTSCSREEPEEPTIEQQPTTAQLTNTVHYAADKMTAYNFTYTSTDPYGEPVTLSATITMSDKLTTNDIAEGIMLYNHFTVYRADQCPSLGYLGEQAMIVGSGLITISPDYYGFGVTEDKPQAYCISRDNAQAAVDALIEGRKLLANMGFRWKDNLFNVGYSQGGQTSLAVVRLITEKYPNIHITKTFAGGGSYDLPATYRRFVVIDRSAMPSTVISVMLAYNHFKELGIARDSMFLEPVLSHIDDWVLNKRYTREEIDALVGTNDLSVFITPAMMDTNSSVSHRMMAALDGDNLCKGWTPRSDESLMLVHHTLDGAVPVENTLNLIAFLQQQGVTDVDVVVGDFGNAMGMPAHETGALMLINAAKEWLCQYLGIAAW
ncbi:MAG: hypothetical protein II661_03725 [Bacteroidales bacterium]|nr:hypothetical protein [Bacteroidales bacterium]